MASVHARRADVWVGAPDEANAEVVREILRGVRVPSTDVRLAVIPWDAVG